MPIKVMNSLEDVRDAMTPPAMNKRQRMKATQHCACAPGTGNSAIGQRQLMGNFDYNVNGTAITPENAFFWRKAKHLYTFYEGMPEVLRGGTFPDVAGLINDLKTEAGQIFKEIKKTDDKSSDAYKEMISQAVLGISGDIALGVCAGTHFTLNFHNGLHSSCVGSCAKEIIEENGLAQGVTSRNDTISAFLKYIVTAKGLGYEWSFLKHYNSIAYLCGLAHDLALQWKQPSAWNDLLSGTADVPANLQAAEVIWDLSFGFGRLASSCCKNKVDTSGNLVPSFGTFNDEHKLKVNCTDVHPRSPGTEYDPSAAPSAWEIMANTACVWSMSTDHGLLIEASAGGKTEYVIGSEALSVFYLFRIIEEVTDIAYAELGNVGDADSSKKLLNQVVMPPKLRRAIVENIRFTVPCFYEPLKTVINYGRFVPVSVTEANGKKTATPDGAYLDNKIASIGSGDWDKFYEAMMDVLHRVTAVGDLGESSFEAHFSTIFLSQGIIYEEKPQIIFHLWRAFEKLAVDWVAEENKESLKRAAVAYVISWQFFDSQKSFSESRNVQLEEYLIKPVKDNYGSNFTEPGAENAQNAYKHLLYLFANVAEKKKNANASTMLEHLNNLMQDFTAVASYIPEAAVPENAFGKANSNASKMTEIFPGNDEFWAWTTNSPSRNWDAAFNSLKELTVLDLKQFVFAQFTTLALRLCGDVVDKDFDNSLNPKGPQQLSQSKNQKKNAMLLKAKKECDQAKERLLAMLVSENKAKFFQKPDIEGTKIPTCRGLEALVEALKPPSQTT
eukprot:CAMPEP_0177687890 /NCGR_PEP_ID=MMETSP0447-20121125/34374_1 /TAXON_ID=0 /ORGANISM="Stygamoeba regulata, Strain BSH-02190019" /LENGTH=783 /DNA_ID=CAMNT_0019198171 /DNA_START=102 /DNA_END=2453 /DNA_ORIENTATION=-